jgi:hypothetical protein
MLDQINDLYADKAYLNALCDWLIDTYGDESPEVKAAMMLANGDAVIIDDPRPGSAPEARYDLLVSSKISGQYADHVTQLMVDGLLDMGQSPTSQQLAYVDLLRPHIGKYRYSYESPLALFDRIVESLEDEGVDWPDVDEVAKELGSIRVSYCTDGNGNNTDDDDDSDYIDVRLQVMDNGSWDVLWGDSGYDTDHRGYWGASSIDLDSDCGSIAMELIDQCKEDYYASR